MTKVLLSASAVILSLTILAACDIERKPDKHGCLDSEAQEWNEFADAHGLEPITDEEASYLEKRDIQRMKLAVKAKTQVNPATEPVMVNHGKYQSED